MITHKKILIIEDEKNLGSTLRDYLNTKGFNCILATTITQARTLFNESQSDFSIVLMDIGLPDGSGLTLAKEFRDKRQDFVLFFLSALSDPETRVEGLVIGAQDYITKPFDLRELTLRLERALSIQEKIQNIPHEIRHGKLTIWFSKYEVADALGNLIPLSQKECAILELLYQRKNMPVDRDEIIEEVWGQNAFPTNRTVDNYIVKLRKWCETDPEKGIQILSMRGVGYKLVVQA